MLKKIIASLLLTIFLVACCIDLRERKIQGVVSDVEFITGGGNFLNPGEKTIVRFQDGRIKVFSNINSKITIYKGKENIIYYSSNNEILRVKLVKDE